MKIKFIKEGSPDCPIIILWGNSRVDYRSLSDNIKNLIVDVNKSFIVNDINNFTSVDGIKLGFKCTSLNLGVKSVGDNYFVLELTKESWERVLQLLEPFVKIDNGTGYQWLNETSDISLLVSRDGEW